MKNFVYNVPASRVIFGVGAVSRLREEVERLAVRRPLFISTPGRRKDAEHAARSLTGMAAAVYAEAVMHVPIDSIVKARDAAARHQADGIVAFGGGSAIDTSKPLALELGLPVVAVPMTYGGSEV